jgi:hypothetical protein
MLIAPGVLLGQYQRTITAWPFIPEVEASYRLPRCLLIAVASRETNCRNVVGDGGHGHGMFQYDDRSHAIPAGFDHDVRLQAETAAAMLRGLIDAFQGAIRPALDGYNAGAGAVRAALKIGRDPDSVTTGRNYGSDVLERMSYLQLATSPAAPAQPVVVGPPVTISRGTLGGKPVAVQIVSIPTDQNGDGSVPAPAGFLAVMPAGSHDKYDATGHDVDSIVVPVGARASGTGWRLVVAHGPASTIVGAPVLVSD